jgi:hypothetical protein
VERVAEKLRELHRAAGAGPRADLRLRPVERTALRTCAISRRMALAVSGLALRLGVGWLIGANGAIRPAT